MSNKESRRNEVLEAARSCLARYGFDKMTMDDVGREVGLNKASLYYYYRSKEAMVSDVLKSEANYYIQALRQKVEIASGCSNRIQTYLIERFRISQHVVNLHHMSLNNFRQLRPLFRRLNRQFREDEVDFISKILQHCLEKGEIGVCDVRKVAKSIFLIAEAYKTEVVENPDLPPDSRVDYTSIEDDLVFTVSLILDGLRVKKSIRSKKE